MRYMGIVLALGLVILPSAVEASPQRLLSKLRTLTAPVARPASQQAGGVSKNMPLVPLTYRDLDQVSGAGCSMQVGSKTYFANAYGGDAFVRSKGDARPIFLNSDGDFDLDKPSKRSFTISGGSGAPPVVIEFIPLATKWKNTEEEQSSKPVLLRATQLMKNGSSDYSGRVTTLFTLQGIMSCGA